jgi:hypothetical protein
MTHNEAYEKYPEIMGINKPARMPPPVIFEPAENVTTLIFLEIIQARVTMCEVLAYVLLVQKQAPKHHIIYLMGTEYQFHPFVGYHMLNGGTIEAQDPIYTYDTFLAELDMSRMVLASVSCGAEAHCFIERRMEIGY